MQPLPLGESGWVWVGTASGVTGLRPERGILALRGSGPVMPLEDVPREGGQRPP
jgi:hypothetical protein